MHYSIPRDHERLLIAQLQNDPSPAAQRICRLYAMPDLTRTLHNPIQEVVDRICAILYYHDFDTIQTPEIVGLYETFDLFNFASNHPARNPSDTYFVAADKILRTHTTIMRYYYLNHPGIKEKLAKNGEVKALSRGKVYRRDEIDWKHHCVFHQIDGLYLVDKEKKTITKEHLATILVDIVKEVYGPTVPCRVFDDQFPYTDPSLQVEIYTKNPKGEETDIELFGSGLVHAQVLENLGIDSTKYHGRAFGLGIERLAMPKMQIPDIRLFWSEDPRVTAQRGNLDRPYVPVSKYPSTTRDISFILPKAVSLNEYYDLVRDLGGDLVEAVECIDTYENEKKLGADMISRTFRIVYRSHERTLETDEVNEIQLRIRQETATRLGAEVR